MGVAIIDKTASFDPANSLGKLVPVMGGLELLNFDGKMRGINQLIGGKAVAVIGAPANENDNVTNYSETAYLKTQSPCTASGTFIAVVRLFRNTGTLNSTLAGWYVNNGKRGVSLINATGSLLLLSCMALGTDGLTMTARNAQLSLTAFTSDTTPAAGRWACVAGRWYTNSSGVLTLELNNLTEGTGVKGLAAVGETLVTDTGGNPFAVGSGYTAAGAQGAGVKAMGFTGLWSRALTDDELKQMYAGYLQGYFSRRGIVI